PRWECTRRGRAAIDGTAAHADAAGGARRGLLGHDPLEPAEDLIDAREPPAGEARAVADLDRHAAERVHGAKAGLVRDVVSDEHRGAPDERRFRREPLDRAPLVRDARLDLEDAVARQNLDVRRRLALQLADEETDVRLELRPLPVVHGEGDPLVLDPHAFVPGDEGLDLASHALEAVTRGEGRDAPVRPAALEAMDAGGRKTVRREDPIHVLDSPAADHRDGTAARLRQLAEQAQQPRRRACKARMLD